MKIYTKTGDGGTTSLFGGGRVTKDSLRVEAYGKADELNSMLGVVLTENPPADISKKILRIQGEIFVLGADLATPINLKVKVPRINKNYISRLEKEIDRMEKDLPKLKNFILPGGGKVGSRLHLARSVSRCLERILVTLDRTDKINPKILPYINRLSDWLYVLARHANYTQNFKEVPWSGRA
jgi:cob(I)alamin adenosyltransferase